MDNSELLPEAERGAFLQQRLQQQHEERMEKLRRETAIKTAEAEAKRAETEFKKADRLRQERYIRKVDGINDLLCSGEQVHLVAGKIAHIHFRRSEI